MAALQLQFNLRTSAHCKTVHLLGSWDNYNGQLPLSTDSTLVGGWKGTFRFQGATLKQGQRYWYYYIIDGYHVSHDPNQASTKEPTTGRTLNILDVPVIGAAGGMVPLPKPARESQRLSIEIPKGRPLSASQIKHPKPVKPNQTRHFTDANYTIPPSVAQLTSRFSNTTIGDEYIYSSPPSSVGSSLSSRSGSSSPSSASSLSDYSSGASSICTCERYGITRLGDRVKIDCRGSRCGYSDGESSSCCSDEDDSYLPRSTRRQGIVVRR